MIYYEGEIQIDPKPKGRPRFAKRGNFVTTYTDKQTKDYESLLRELIKKAYDKDPCQDWCSLKLIFHLPRPKSISEKKRPYPTVKPDIDNLAKAFLDSANGILFKDDNIIISLYVSKLYSDKGSIYFKLQGQ